VKLRLELVISRTVASCPTRFILQLSIIAISIHSRSGSEDLLL